MTETGTWEGLAPRLTFCRSLAAAAPHLPPRALFHAGPAYDGPAACPRPVRNAAIAAMLAEGWAADPAMAEAAILAGDVTLLPAQDHGLVTPLACVVSPSMPVLAVEAGGQRILVPVNDGPPEGALRFGRADPRAQVARIAEIRALAAPLDRALAGGIELLPLMAQALEAGDDLHGSVAAMTAGLADRLGLAGAADAYARTPLFALNPVMAAAAAMLRAARFDMPTVIAAGGNGVAFGWQGSAAPGIWHTRPALPPVGPRMDGGAAAVLPAIGDSAVIDALGLGGAVLRRNPALAEALAPFHPPETFAAPAAFLAPHPALPGDIRLGLPAQKVAAHPGIMLAMLGAQGEGLVGRGLAPWPA
ncbi:oxamate carbamoyltransferase subunit AllG family protein [Mangrovicoccus algicola]|uniref:DUF1116 domain-containing protein n=1 Tax=Mangrovicoccus algicola TaxID=2771008 RepID=A0A8J7CM05_9RHOB|nr:DUF1116 domain-containing protein [Mangrovicoccus algicola]MBE3640066.1 DUF1116 domain-containing protein [Mangrovicoccus algicola]